MEKILAKAIGNLVSKLPLATIEENTKAPWRPRLRKHQARRPDLSVTSILGVKWATNLAYDEAKSAMYSDDHLIICKDLIKVARFCKDALDDQLFEGILAHLYHDSSGNYQVQDSINDLPGLFYKVPDIAKVLDIFERDCVRAAHPETIKHRCAPTFLMANMQQLFSQSKNRKRYRHIKFYHN
ncbi:hypothetical protein BDB00DRAFT_791996 [Zychaea mexicana]|uniref:uncharacterized protein n=1 Tax=Zychaea mexicana TaxID=64656 RepID=UPI0022FDE439|nr:uncharacterized protein BDB00DRAFT_791996 [Zychaea mexicana]KAI9488234.1 hypothetical protein BDB00DRAFT_791996 [Zychaea mexicana]